jgi:hypothetical protein
MQAQFHEIWERASVYYHTHLKDRECGEIEEISSQEHLLIRLRHLETSYAAKSISKYLQKSYPFVAQLRSFTKVINIFVQGEEIACLVWGPIALIFEVWNEFFSARSPSKRPFVC